MIRLLPCAESVVAHVNTFVLLDGAERQRRWRSTAPGQFCHRRHPQPSDGHQGPSTQVCMAYDSSRSLHSAVCNVRCSSPSDVNAMAERQSVCCAAQGWAYTSGPCKGQQGCDQTAESCKQAAAGDGRTRDPGLSAPACRIARHAAPRQHLRPRQRASDWAHQVLFMCLAGCRVRFCAILSDSEPQKTQRSMAAKKRSHQRHQRLLPQKEQTTSGHPAWALTNAIRLFLQRQDG